MEVSKTKDMLCSEADGSHSNPHCGPCPTGKYGDLQEKVPVAVLFCATKEGVQPCQMSERPWSQRV